MLTFSMIVGFYFVPLVLYGLDCWAISKMDARKIDVLDQWCLCAWHQMVPICTE